MTGPQNPAANFCGISNGRYFEVQKRPDWPEYFMGIADAVAARADCLRRKVGCVLVDPDYRIISTGYNGAPSGDTGCLAGGCPRGQMSYDIVVASSDYDAGPGRCIAIHAEANALLYARASCKGATAVITAPPCPTCSKLLRAAGVERFVFRDADTGMFSRVQYGVSNSPRGPV